jgi:predicted HAD superfamily Cof-like phosphohydrolase|tara:strand:- start:97 stop:471 length:375 start_codon:yes stop_codon:yes gene_type:complete
MNKVREFHEKMKLAIDEPYSKELMDFRLKLLFEEIQELATAALDIEELNDKDDRYGLMQNLLKEMCDVVYVIKGMAVSFGMDFDGAFKLVHKSNMSKLPLIKDADGKVMKGLNYEPPILEGLVH